MEAMGSGGPTEDDMREALQKLDPLWDELFPAEKERIVKLLVKEVIVSKNGLLIRLRLNGPNSLVAELQGEGPAELGQDGQTVDIRVPMGFQVRSGRKEVILPSGAEVEPETKTNGPLALARAYKWQQILESGQATSLDEIARQMKVDRSYIGRILRLPTLAPDIVEAVLRGDEPSGLSLKSLRDEIPLSWNEQRSLFRSN